MNIKNITRKTLLLISMIGILTIAAISAMFSSSDFVTNSLSASHFDIELIESKWNYSHNNVTPNEELDKDPKIKNNGDTDAYVFIEVSVPYYSNVRYETDNEGGWAWGNVPCVKFINSAGKSSDSADFAQTVNEHWYLISESDSSETEPKTHTYIYAYVENAALPEGKSAVLKILPCSEDTETPALFDKIKFFNARPVGNIPIDEEMEISGQSVTIDVYAHGIQAEHLKESGVTTTDPEEVWKILSSGKGS
ncbi:MAG: hypothetical protein E7496_10370 [Ruminococcus sp.]|nr:hypothetical protein [Ruminococcus sp.]